jgi:hypothetical protein
VHSLLYGALFAASVTASQFLLAKCSFFVCHPLYYSPKEARIPVKYKLILKPVARSRNGIEYGTGAVMLYEVEGLPEGQKISIRNVRAESQEPMWQVGGHTTGHPTKWTGAFKTAEEALAQLQREIDSADKATPREIEAVANAVGWKRMPLNDPKQVVLTRGSNVVRVRMADGNWAFYSEIVDGKSPDKWGKDFPSLLAFFSSYEGQSKS